MKKLMNYLKQTKLGQWYDRNFDNKYLSPIIVYQTAIFMVPTIAFVLMLSQHGLFSNDLTIMENYLQGLGLEGLLTNVGNILVLTYILTFIFTAFAGRKLIKEYYYKPITKKLLKTIGITFCVFYFFNAYGCELVAKILGSMGLMTTSDNQALVELLLSSAGFKMTALVVVGSIIEEFVFRLCLMNYIKNRKVASWVSAIYFGLMHFSGVSVSELIMLVVYCGLGYLFVAIYNKTDDIRITTGVHFLNNLLSALLSI